MFKLLTTFLTGFGVLLSLTSTGQERADIPLGALPMQYNPSFAGEASGPRINMNVGYNQYKYVAGTRSNVDIWSRSRGTTFYTSYDQFIPAIRSGVGITTGYTFIGGNSNYTIPVTFTTSYRNKYEFITLTLAPKISLNGKYTISPSLDVSYEAAAINRTLNQEPDTSYGHVNGINQSISSRAGILINSNKFYMGYSVHLFNSNLKSSTYRLGWHVPRLSFQSYLQMGYTFQKKSTSKFSFTPQLLFAIEKSAYQPRLTISPIVINLNFRYKQFIWGLNNAGLHLGWQTNQIRIMLTNSFPVINRTDNNFYEGNLSFRYILKSKDNGLSRGW